MNAIPTKYNGVQFRSRLEAKWAAFFDLVEWDWKYEPLDLMGYIPDFVISFRNSRFIFEVKPNSTDDEHSATIKKIYHSGWDGFSAISFESPVEYDSGTSIGIGFHKSLEVTGQLIVGMCLSCDTSIAIFAGCRIPTCPNCGRIDRIAKRQYRLINDRWIAACNEVQWKKPRGDM